MFHRSVGVEALFWSLVSSQPAGDVVINPVCRYFPPDLRLPYKPQKITVPLAIEALVRAPSNGNCLTQYEWQKCCYTQYWRSTQSRL